MIELVVLVIVAVLAGVDVVNSKGRAWTSDGLLLLALWLLLPLVR